MPLSRVGSIGELNAQLLDACTKRQRAVLRGQSESIAARLQRDRADLLPLPHGLFEACEKVATRVSSLALVRYRTNDYSVSTEYGHREVLVKGFVDQVVISCRGEVIVVHPRSYAREDFIYIQPVTLSAAAGAKAQCHRPSCAPAGLVPTGGT